MKKPRIAIIDNSIAISGALNAILAYAEFARDDFQFLFILPEKSRAINLVLEAGFDVYELPFIELSKRWKVLLLYLPQLLINGVRLRRVIKNNKINLVHVNDFYNLVPILAKAIGGDFRLLTHVRFMPDRFPSRLVRFWVRLSLYYAEKIICVSHAVQRLLPQSKKIIVVYDGLPLFKNKPHTRKVRKGVENLLYLSHFIKGKGQDLALEAFSQAVQVDPSLRLKFVGGTLGLQKNQAFKDTLIKRANQLGLSDVVRFLGPTSNVQTEIINADILLNFSESESFSRTCLEALLLGTPLIATDSGGPAELFVHKESGWLVRNKDLGAMRDAILQLSDNTELRKKISSNSSKFVLDKFSSQNTYELLRKIYFSALD